MPLPPRNAPCPCGSGLKFKRCCGFDRTGRVRRQEAWALAELASHVVESPRMLPLVDGLGEWARRALAGELSREEALSSFPESERMRLLETFGELFPHELREAFGRHDEMDVAAIILSGAIIAGMDDHELAAVPDELVAEIERDAELAAEPVRALALVLAGWRLWEDADGEDAAREVNAIPLSLDDDALVSRFRETLAGVAFRLYDDWHERRLRLMVSQVRAQLPFTAFPRASAVIEEGCARFDSEPGVAQEIAARILVDVLPVEDRLAEVEPVARRAA